MTSTGIYPEASTGIHLEVPAKIPPRKNTRILPRAPRKTHLGVPRIQRRVYYVKIPRLVNTEIAPEIPSGVPRAL